MVTESLKKYLDACVSVRSKRHQLFLGNVRLCSAIFGNFRKMFGNDCLALGQLWRISCSIAYQVEHSTRNSISTHPCIILCLHTKFQPAGFSTGEILEMASIKVLSMTLVGGCPCNTHQNIMQEAHSNFLWRAHS